MSDAVCRAACYELMVRYKGLSPGLAVLMIMGSCLRGIKDPDPDLGQRLAEAVVKAHRTPGRHDDEVNALTDEFVEVERLRFAPVKGSA